MVDGNSLDTAESELAIAAFKQHLACCSFCGRPQTEVKTLVAGPAVFICDRCIRISSKVAEKASKNGKTEVAGLNWGERLLQFPTNWLCSSLASHEKALEHVRARMQLTVEIL